MKKENKTCSICGFDCENEHHPFIPLTKVEDKKAYTEQDGMKTKDKELKKENESLKQQIRLEQNHCKELQAKLDKANIESYNQAIEDVKARLGNWQNTGHFISEISTLKK